VAQRSKEKASGKNRLWRFSDFGKYFRLNYWRKWWHFWLKFVLLHIWQNGSQHKKNANFVSKSLYKQWSLSSDCGVSGYWLK
jgi:hypothetical protein